jgi:ComF family protein
MARSSLEYDEVSKPLILSFKFYDRTEYNKVFAKWLKLAGKDIFDAGVDLIIPIPLHYTRLLKRRYNQSALLAKELSKLSGIKTDYGSVVRHKRTKPQVQFSGSARHRNVKDAFSVKRPINIKGKRIILIDDVMTTGSTLSECAKALLSSGALSVDFLTIARVDG